MRFIRFIVLLLLLASGWDVARAGFPSPLSLPAGISPCVLAVRPPRTPEQLRALVVQRTDSLSFQLLKRIQSVSPFPPHYAYLMIILALSVGAKLLSIPFYIHAVRLGLAMQVLKPEIDTINQLYADEPVEKNEEMQRLFAQHDLKPLSGCALFTLDIIVVIWGLLALNTYSPQLALDGAQFFWLNDITRFNFGVALLWGALTLIEQFFHLANREITTNPVHQVIGTLIMIGICIWIAAHWQWPAYILILWSVLMVVGRVTNLITRAAVKAADPALA